MDIVITYVNGTDPVWQQQYTDATNRPVEPERYRDWGLLPYLFRGIDKHLPFIDNVFLVVSTASQVPAWVSDKVTIVLHEDIIPSRFLPTFNSTTIEMYLHRIPGLSEEFIYFNDDLYPVMPMQPEDFFDEGRVVMAIRRHSSMRRMSVTRSIHRHSDKIARKAAGLCHWPMLFYHSPKHTCAPMLKSSQEELFARIGEEIERHVTPFRRTDNIDQYVFGDYLFHTGRVKNTLPSFAYHDMGVTPIATIVDSIVHPTAQVICINDVPAANGMEEQLETAIKEAFSTHFPDKCKYEK